MLLLFRFNRHAYETAIGYFMTVRTQQIETSLVKLRDEIASLREDEADIPLECRVSLYESHVAPLDAASKLRLIEVLENARIPIVSLDFHHSALVRTHEERDETLQFVKHFQSQITSFKLHGVDTNDFLLAWWLERIFVGTSFLPRLQVLRISSKIVINSAIAMRLFEALVQAPRPEFEKVRFRSSRDPSIQDVKYLATLLRQAYENVSDVRRKISRHLGQYAFAVLNPMLPYNRLVLTFSSRQDNDVEDLFTFDEHILVNDTIPFDDMTLQQFTENYDLFETKWVELFNLYYTTHSPVSVA